MCGIAIRSIAIAGSYTRSSDVHPPAFRMGWRGIARRVTAKRLCTVCFFETSDIPRLTCTSNFHVLSYTLYGMNEMWVVQTVVGESVLSPRSVLVVKRAN